MISYEYVKLTAPEAAEMLTHNPRNRRVSDARVSTMKADMLAGNWRLIPQPISFGPFGRLLDGQHRLTALVEAAKEQNDIWIPVMVATGVDEESFDYMDLGTPRTVANQLQIHDFSDANPLAAAAKQVLRYETYPDRVWTTQADVSKASVLQFVFRHADETERLTRQGRALLTPTAINWSSYLTLNWLVLRLSGHFDQWAEFNEGIITGAGLDLYDPRLTMRNRPLKWAEANKGGHGQQARIACYIKAWNAFVLGREIKVLRWQRSELPMPGVK